MGRAQTRRFLSIFAPFATACLAFSAGCSDSGDHRERPTPPAPSASLFVEGCPEPGKAQAALIQRPDLKMSGPQALGGLGDYLLMNDRAAFIVTGPGNQETYWYYGGIVVDAVALQGCSQAGPDRFEEFWPLAVQMDLGRLIEDLDFGSVILRGFHGQRAEILNDGSDGLAAALRIYGEDDFFWVAEYTLIVEAYRQGRPKPLTSSLGIEMYVDYVLPPDDEVLRITLGYRNLEPAPKEIVPAAANLFGDTTETALYSLASLSLGGYPLRVGVPWISAMSQAGDGGWSFGKSDAVLMLANLGGVDAVLDVREILSPLKLEPAGTAGDTASVTYFLSVGATDAASAESALLQAAPAVFQGSPHGLLPVSGIALEENTDAPVPGATIQVEADDLSGTWQTLHRFVTDKDGRFEGKMSFFGDPGQRLRVTAAKEGRACPAPVLFQAGRPPVLTFRLGPEGRLAYEVLDSQGRPLPARITLWQAGQMVKRILAADGSGEALVAPGTYDAVVTRGFEYEPFQTTLTATGSSQPALLRARLNRVVDTSGYLAFDGHGHAAPSPDSQVGIPDRIRTEAAEGVEVCVSTDHEFIGSWKSGIEETGLGRWVAAISGTEVTASVPEHINLYGIEPSPDLGGRGGFLKWYRKDLTQIFAEARARGAKVISLNHPGYLRLIDYDRILGRARLEDPTLLGLDPTAQLWSWNFDVVEYMNGHESPFSSLWNPEGTGRFDDWMSFVNLGHPIAAVATSDVHGLDFPGQPRTYVRYPSESLEGLDEDLFLASLRAGRAVVSDGAFARVAINGTSEPGDTAIDPDGSVDLSVRIEAISEIDVTYFVVFFNCDQILKIQTPDPDGIVKYDGTMTLSLPSDGHIVVAGFGAKRLPLGMEQFTPDYVPRFTTNPIYVDVDGNGVFDPPGGKTCSYDLSAPGQEVP